MLLAEWRPGHRAARSGRRQDEVLFQDTNGTNARLLLFLCWTQKSDYDDNNEKRSRGRYEPRFPHNACSSSDSPLTFRLSSPPSVGVEEGTLLKCVNDIAAAAQHTVAAHLAKRTHRAILFCKANGLLPDSSPTLVSLLGYPHPPALTLSFLSIVTFTFQSQDHYFLYLTLFCLMFTGGCSY